MPMQWSVTHCRARWAMAVWLSLSAFSGAATGLDFCPPLPPPKGRIISVDESQAAELPSIVASAREGTTILLARGTYQLRGNRLIFTTPNVILRGETGNRDEVLIEGDYVSSELISVFASNVIIADLSLAHAYTHPIHITPPPGQNISGILIYNVRVTDPGQQGIKINPSDGANHADSGRIECSRIELTDQGRPQIRDHCYTGGIDAHRARHWVIADNWIEGFWCEQGLSEHGIHFWRASEGTLVERNRLVNNARGIGFGLGPNLADGHYNGIIRNNFVSASDRRLFLSGAGFDVGIGLESAPGAVVVHNTVASTMPPFVSIEWRFPTTMAVAKNNLATHNIRPRDGALAEAAQNLSYAPADYFLDLRLGDLHLTPDALGAIDQGADLELGVADEDIDGNSRLKDPRDIGAHELVFKRVRAK